MHRTERCEEDGSSIIVFWTLAKNTVLGIMNFLCTCNIQNDVLSEKRDRRFLSYFFLWSDPTRKNWRHCPMIESGSHYHDPNLLEKSKRKYAFCPVHYRNGSVIPSICDAIGNYKNDSAWLMTRLEMAKTGEPVLFYPTDRDFADIDRRIELFIGRSTERCTISKDDYKCCNASKKDRWVGQSVPFLHFAVYIGRDSYDFGSFDCVLQVRLRSGYAYLSCGPGALYVIRAIIACLIDLPLPTYVLAIVVGLLIGERVERALLTCDLSGNHLSSDEEKGFLLRDYRASGKRNGLVPLIDNVKFIREQQQQHRQNKRLFAVHKQAK